MRSPSAKAARQGLLLATLFPVCASGPGAPAPGSPRQKPRRLYIFLAQGPFPACARTRALPRTARQMSKQISPSPFMERGQGGEVFFWRQGGEVFFWQSVRSFQFPKTKNPPCPAPLRGDQFPSNPRAYAPGHPYFHAKIFPDGLPTAL